MKVLMLGWEFPPLINGGLGIACLGLSRALAKKVELSFIVPKVDPEFLVDQLELIGLNHLDGQKFNRTRLEESLENFGEVSWVEGALASGLQPYGTAKPQEVLTYEDYRTWAEGKISQLPEEGQLTEKLKAQGLENKLAMFSEDTLYGEDVGERVWAYAQVAASIAQEKEFDVVHAHDWMTFVAGMEISRWCSMCTHSTTIVVAQTATAGSTILRKRRWRWRIW